MREWAGEDFDPHFPRCPMSSQMRLLLLQSMVAKASSDNEARDLIRGLHRRLTKHRRDDDVELLVPIKTGWSGIRA